jgi:hypothetical protein
MMDESDNATAKNFYTSVQALTLINRVATSKGKLANLKNVRFHRGIYIGSSLDLVCILPTKKASVHYNVKFRSHYSTCGRIERRH